MGRCAVDQLRLLSAGWANCWFLGCIVHARSCEHVPVGPGPGCCAPPIVALHCSESCERGVFVQVWYGLEWWAVASRRTGREQAGVLRRSSARFTSQAGRAKRKQHGRQARRGGIKGQLLGRIAKCSVEFCQQSQTLMSWCTPIALTDSSGNPLGFTSCCRSAPPVPRSIHHTAASTALCCSPLFLGGRRTMNQSLLNRHRAFTSSPATGGRGKACQGLRCTASPSAFLGRTDGLAPVRGARKCEDAYSSSSQRLVRARSGAVAVECSASPEKMTVAITGKRAHRTASDFEFHCFVQWLPAVIAQLAL